MQNFDFSHMKGDKLQMHFYCSLNWHLYKVEIGAEEFNQN
jgi:hypothetical protein